MKKYINVQLKREIHSIVKEHCKTSKQTISGCIEKLIIDNLIDSNININRKNILKVHSNDD